MFVGCSCRVASSVQPRISLPVSVSAGGEPSVTPVEIAEFLSLSETATDDLAWPPRCRSRTGAVLRRFRLSVDSPFPLGVPHEPNREPLSSPRHSCDDRCCLRSKRGARPSDLIVSMPPMGSFALRPGDLLTILKMALSIGFRNQFPSCYPSYGSSDFSPGGSLSH
jgi:hypothetical protein